MTHEHCNYCGDLDWTVASYGRVTHKESCPHRLDAWHQGAPHDPLREAVARALWEAQPEGSSPRISWEEAKHPQVKSAGPVYALADAAIRVVLAEARRSVEALAAQRDLRAVSAKRHGAAYTQVQAHRLVGEGLDEALAVLAALEPPPPV